MSKTKEHADARDFAKHFLEHKDNKDYHYNLHPIVEDYVVSSGSLKVDYLLGGGFGSGLHRFVGANESGKTHEALQVCYNMLKQLKNSKGLYVKAEGRLGKNVRNRSGLKFVYHPDDWELGTVLVLESNVYDTVFDFIRGILKNNKAGEQFCIIIDSMDGLISKGDLEKTTSEAAKIAAGATLTSDFLKRVSLAMNKGGHMCIMISQVRAQPKTTQYAASDPNNRTNATGGNALQHFTDWIIEFRKQRGCDYITAGKEGPISMDNPAFGHMCRLKICKSDNEKTMMEIAYPIKYGRVGGKSIWVERELAEVLLGWEYMEKKGKSAWLDTSDDFKDLLADLGVTDFPEKVQGVGKLNDYLEEQSDTCNVLKEYFVKFFTGGDEV